MEHNPLTKEGADLIGIEKLAAMLEVNKTLTSLNLWRSKIGMIPLHCRGSSLT